MKKIIYFIIIFLLTLLLIETIFYFKNDDKSNFFITFNPIGKPVGHNIGYVDPLLGWTHSYHDIQKGNYSFEESSPVLYTKNNCIKEINIVISGGSTSDLLLGGGSWIYYLFKIFEENNYCVNVKAIGVSGYNSGQEYLKLIRDIHVYKPDIHISYSGVNEYPNFSYTTFYENEFFKKTINKKSVFMPNFTNFYSAKLRKATMTDVIFYELQNKIESYEYWQKNMILMKSLSSSFNYTFIGVLQPTLGIGPHKEQVQLVSNSVQMEQTISNYRYFYKQAFEIVGKHEFLVDFTNIFVNEQEVPFYDDCHLKEPFQEKLAWHFYNLLIEKNQTQYSL